MLVYLGGVNVCRGRSGRYYMDGLNVGISLEDLALGRFIVGVGWASKSLFRPYDKCKCNDS